MKFAFFGTPKLAATALSKMESLGLVPSLIVSTPDAPVGRKQIITPTPTKVWAMERNIPVFQPTTLKERAGFSILTDTNFDFFVVFAYGKIMPEWLLSIPKYGTINAHPSLLPKLRGASPIRSTLLTDHSAAGVTIIQMDKEMDHGPILLKRPVALTEPISGEKLDQTMSLICGELLVEVMRALPLGHIIPRPQDHAAATFCTKITKDMAELKINPYQLLTGHEATTSYDKICAFAQWPETFFIHEGKRYKIKSAHLKDGNLVIERIVPEGKSETDFSNYFKPHGAI